MNLFYVFTNQILQKEINFSLKFPLKHIYNYVKGQTFDWFGLSKS